MTLPITPKPPPPTRPTSTYKPAPPAYHQLTPSSSSSPFVVGSQEPPSYTVALSRTVSRPWVVASEATSASEPITTGTRPTPSKRTSKIFSSSSSKSASTSTSTNDNASQGPIVDPRTYLPPTFKIGLRYTPPLVTLPEVKMHLLILSGIEECLGSIKRDAMKGVEQAGSEMAGGDGGSEDLGNVITPDVAVAAFLSLSAWEFDRWVISLHRRKTNKPKPTSDQQAADPTITPFGLNMPRASTAPGSGGLRGGEEEEGDYRDGGWSARELPRNWGVIMIWHAYCLNPRWYADDTKNREELRVLDRAGGFPFGLISRYINPETLEYRPPGVDKPVPAPTVDQLRSTRIHIDCPYCSTPTEVPLISPAPALDGYAQKAFTMVCSKVGCYTKVDHELLKVGKFIEDLRRIVKGEMETLPGMLLRPSNGLEDITRPRLFSQLVARMFIDQFDKRLRLFPHRTNGKLDADRTKLTVLKKLHGYTNRVEPYPQDELRSGVPYGHSIPSVQGIVEALQRYISFEDFHPNQMKYYHETLKSAVNDGRFKTWVGGFRYTGDEAPRRFGKMWSAYTTAGLASLDLGEATARQSGFIGKMKEMGWLERDKFEGESRLFLLQKSVARYHAFLDLMSGFPEGFLCPTLDIDLAWHTHQLKHPAYRAETCKFIGRFVDHDDKVSESKLGDAYSYTAKRWLDRFGVPYSACGCHQGDGLVGMLDPTLGLSDKLKFWNKNKGPTPKDVTLIMDGEMGEEEREVTHPSTHNIVRIRGSDGEESRRRSRMAEDSQRDRPVDYKNTPKDPEKAQLAAIFRKKPQHQDPFLYTSSRSAVDQGGFREDAYRIGAESGRGGNSKLYWGVSAGAGIVIGGGVVWGMSTDDCQNVDADQLQSRAGACAVGAGPAAGGFCGAGGEASCASAACAGTGGAGSCGGGGGGDGGGGGGGCGGGGGGGGGGGCGGGGA